MTTTNPPEVSQPAEPKTAPVQTLTELKAGRFLGRYELLMPVAQGGMAVVWAARLVGTRGFQKVVAIKTMLPSLSEDARFEQMFLDEAGLAARIRHPNVVQVLDLGEEEGVLYQAMEWIDGEPLSVLLRAVRDKQCVPHAIAAKILIGVCKGLHAAHETLGDDGVSVGLVHRDVSPQNVLLTRDGVPKIVDFGVAKACALAGEHTVVGMLKGKPAYMAPEQVRGEDIDRRADIFSLGVLLYMLTTGRDPFRGPSDVATLRSIVSADPAEKPSVQEPGYPSGLEDVVMTAIDKSREQRFPTAIAMARALESAVPEVHMLGDGDVAAYVRDLLGDRLDKRQASLRKALGAADARGSRPEAGLATLTGLGPTPGSQPSVVLMAPTKTGASVSLAPNVTTLTIEGPLPLLMPARSNARRLAAVGFGLLLAVGVLTLAGYRTFTTASRETASAPVEPEMRAASPIEPSPNASAAPEEKLTSVPEPKPSATSKPSRPARPIPTPPLEAPAASATAPGAPAPAISTTATQSAGGAVRGTLPTIRDPGF